MKTFEFTAKTTAWVDCKIDANTEEEAIAKMKKLNDKGKVVWTAGSIDPEELEIREVDAAGKPLTDFREIEE